MARTTRWRDLRTGIAVIAAAAALVVGTLIFGRLGRIPGETYHVYVQAEEARGIIRGSEVWLAGQKVGAVRDIEFLPPAAGSPARVLLYVELMARHRNALRKDSRVEIRPGGSLIGAPVVSLSIGTPGAPVIRDGDTIQAQPQQDLASAAERFEEVFAEVPTIQENLGSIGAVMRSPDGTVGAFMHERGGRDLAEARASMATLAARVRNEPGTAGLALRHHRELMARARMAMGRADSIRQLLGSPGTSLGRFRRDSTLAGHIADVRNELSIVQALLRSPEGTVGRLAADSAIVAGLADVEGEMARLLADVKARPFRYLSF